MITPAVGVHNSAAGFYGFVVDRPHNIRYVS